jgi:hypothetical protein
MCRSRCKILISLPLPGLLLQAALLQQKICI